MAKPEGKESEELQSDLAIADALIGAGGLAYAKNMRSATAITQAWNKLQHAIEEDRTSIDANTTEATLDNIAREMAQSIPA